MKLVSFIAEQLHKILAFNFSDLINFEN